MTCSSRKFTNSEICHQGRGFRGLMDRLDPWVGHVYLPVSDVPNELRQDVQEGHEEVGDGEVVHEVVHPRRRLPAQLPPQRRQDDPVAQQGDQEDDGLQVGTG